MLLCMIVDNAGSVLGPGESRRGAFWELRGPITQEQKDRGVATRRRRQAEKARVQKADSLSCEEAYTAELLGLMPEVVDQNLRINRIITRILEQVENKELLTTTELRIFKTLVEQRDRWVDRMYGKATARHEVDSSQSHLVVDVAKLLQENRRVLQERDLPAIEGEVAS